MDGEASEKEGARHVGDGMRGSQLLQWPLGPRSGHFQEQDFSKTTAGKRPREPENSMCEGSEERSNMVYLGSPEAFSGVKRRALCRGSGGGRATDGLRKMGEVNS